MICTQQIAADQFMPPRPLEEIDAELKELEAEIAGLLKEVAG